MHWWHFQAQCPVLACYLPKVRYQHRYFHILFCSRKGLSSVQTFFLFVLNFVSSVGQVYGWVYIKLLFSTRFFIGPVLATVFLANGRSLCYPFLKFDLVSNNISNGGSEAESLFASPLRLSSMVYMQTWGWSTSWPQWWYVHLIIPFVSVNEMSLFAAQLFYFLFIFICKISPQHCRLTHGMLDDS